MKKISFYKKAHEEWKVRCCLDLFAMCAMSGAVFTCPPILPPHTISSFLFFSVKWKECEAKMNERKKSLIILTQRTQLINRKIVLEIMSEITRSETSKSAFSNAIIWMIPPSTPFHSIFQESLCRKRDDKRIYFECIRWFKHQSYLRLASISFNYQLHRFNYNYIVQLARE